MTHGQRSPVFVVALGVALGLMLFTDATVARAQRLVLVEPASAALNFGAVNLGATSATQRITIANMSTSDPGSVELNIDDPAFAIIGSGGDLSPGHSAFWDIAVTPTERTLEHDGTSSFVLVYVGSDDEDHRITVEMSCRVRRVPFDAPNVRFERPGPGTTTTRRLVVVNTGAEPLRITAFTSTDPAYSAVLHTGGLPITIAPEAMFEIDIRFAPLAPNPSLVGTIAATLDDATSQRITEVRGSAADLVDFATCGFEAVPVGQTWRCHAALANYTGQPVTVTGIAIANPVFAIEGLAVGDVVPPFSSLPMFVAVTPTVPGDVSSTYTFSFDTALALSGGWQTTGTSPLLRVVTHDDSPDDGLLDFGEILPGSAPVTRQLTLSNSTTLGIFIECRMFGGIGDGFASTTVCPGLLMPGQSVDIDITFTPVPPEPTRAGDRRISGYRFTELGVLHNVIQLTALVPSYAFLASTNRVQFDDTLCFPSVPPTSEVSITNTSLVPIPIPAATTSGAGFSVASAPPPGTLAPFGTITYRVAFAPETPGSIDGTLQLGALAEIALHGTGVLRVVSAESAIEFGNVAVGSSVRQLVTIHNAGTQPVTASMLVTSDPQFQVVAPADPTVPAGGDLVIELAFAPSATGASAAEVAISFDADPAPQLTVALTGTGTATTPGHGCSSGRHGGDGALVVVVSVLGLLVRRRHAGATRESWARRVGRRA